MKAIKWIRGRALLSQRLFKSLCQDYGYEYLVFLFHEARWLSDGKALMCFFEL